MSDTDGEWHQTACILCSVNCGIEVKRRRRGASPASAATRRTPARRATRARRRCALDHYQNGRDRLTSPLRAAPTARSRRSTGTRRSPRSPRGSARCATSTAARRSSTTAAAGRGTTSAAATRARPRAALGVALHVERARPGEDRRVLGRRAAVRPPALPHDAATSSTPRSPCSSARTRGSRTASRGPAPILKEIAKDPDRALIVDRPAPHRDAPTWPTSTSRCGPGADAFCLAALLAVLVQEDLLDDAFLAEHADRPTRCSRRSARTSTSPAACGRAGVDEELVRDVARRIGRGGERLDLRGPRHPAGAALDAQLATSRSCSCLLTGNFGAPGRHEPAHAARQRSAAAVARATAPTDAGHRAPHRHRAGALQRDPRRDPHRPSRPLPRDDRRELATRRTRSPTASGCARRSTRWTSSVVIDVAHDRDRARWPTTCCRPRRSSRSGRRRSSTSSSRANAFQLRAADPRAAARHAARAGDPRPARAAPCGASPTRTSAPLREAAADAGGPRSPTRSSRVGRRSPSSRRWRP